MKDTEKHDRPQTDAVAEPSLEDPEPSHIPEKPAKETTMPAQDRPPGVIMDPDEIVMASPLYVAPIKMPKEVREMIEHVVSKQQITMVEYVLHWLMFGAGYDIDSIIATRKLAHPNSSLMPIKRDD